MRILFFIVLLSYTCTLFAQNVNTNSILDVNLTDTLLVPKVSEGKPAAGKRVSITPKRFSTGEVKHILYLPEHWHKNWRETNERLPIIFEYTGNYYPPAGSTGKVEDASLGYSLTRGKYIWVTLPYISKGGKSIPLKWWGNTKATVDYAKTYVPEIIEEFGGDTNAVFLCGFSRGAIAVNYIGLFDNEIASIWTGFITHDHFDGVKEWKITDWGSPLKKYRQEASKRLERVNGRPYLVIQNGAEYGSKEFVSSVLPWHENFTFQNISTKEIFGSFPNNTAIHEHNDVWGLLPSKYRNETAQWLNGVLAESKKRQLFEKFNQLAWETNFSDLCTKRWKKNWTMDGEKASITQSENGMDFKAGPNRKENASHAVLWTKQSFEGDIRIEYEYTKTDDRIEAVNILYIQASGSTAEGYDKDIAKWADKRKIAAMSEYFNHMNTFHISYAAFDIGNTRVGNDYIRARRYIPEGDGLSNTDLKPDYFETGLFEKDVPHKITIIKKGEHLFMQIKNDEQTYLCHWLTSQVPAITEGRIGLRHMWTRGARYKNFKVSTLNN